jgi:hypothetical protein
MVHAAHAHSFAPASRIQRIRTSSVESRRRISQTPPGEQGGRTCEDNRPGDVAWGMGRGVQERPWISSFGNAGSGVGGLASVPVQRSAAPAGPRRS